MNIGDVFKPFAEGHPADPEEPDYTGNAGWVVVAVGERGRACYLAVDPAFGALRCFIEESGCDDPSDADLMPDGDAGIFRATATVWTSRSYEGESDSGGLLGAVAGRAFLRGAEEPPREARCAWRGGALVFDGTLRAATVKECNESPKGLRFRCGLCGFRFKVGDLWRGVYANRSGKPCRGNFIVCLGSFKITSPWVEVTWPAMEPVGLNDYPEANTPEEHAR